jgi:predicted nucleic acid-binding protein
MLSSIIDAITALQYAIAVQVCADTAKHVKTKYGYAKQGIVCLCIRL